MPCSANAFASGSRPTALSHSETSSLVQVSTSRGHGGGLAGAVDAGVAVGPVRARAARLAVERHRPRAPIVVGRVVRSGRRHAHEQPGGRGEVQLAEAGGQRPGRLFGTHRVRSLRRVVILLATHRPGLARPGTPTTSTSGERAEINISWRKLTTTGNESCWASRVSALAPCRGTPPPRSTDRRAATRRPSVKAFASGLRTVISGALSSSSDRRVVQRTARTRCRT